jgi:hypothetical protein
MRRRSGADILDSCGFSEDQTYFCSCCEEPCSPNIYDNSISHDYGRHEVIDIASDCCEAELFEGEVTVSKQTKHTARKDHYDLKGNLICKAGEVYRAYFARGYYWNDKDETFNYYYYRKEKIK